jgi:predicted transcriptional regulator
MIQSVRDLMSPAQRCVDRFDTVVQVARRMRGSGVSSIPVSGAHGMFIGMLSDRDIIERCVADARDPQAVSAGSLLDGVAPMVEPSRCADASVLGMILRQPLAELPVVENGVLVGMISAADLAVPLIADDLVDDLVDDMVAELWPGRDA